MNLNLDLDLDLDLDLINRELDLTKYLHKHDCRQSFIFLGSVQGFRMEFLNQLEKKKRDSGGGGGGEVNPFLQQSVLLSKPCLRSQSRSSA